MIRRWIIQQPGVKVVSLLMACMLWFGLAYRVETIQRQYFAPIEVRNLPAGWAIDGPPATRARLTLSGSERDFDRFDPGGIAVSLELSRPREGTVEFALGEEQVTGLANLKVLEIDPAVLRLTAYQVAERLLPVRVPVRGEPPPQWRLVRIETRPAQVEATAPLSRAADVTTVDTEPIDLGQIQKTTVLPLKLELPPRVRLTPGQPSTVEVTVVLEPSSADAARSTAP
jgi:YbbR domain-containing protein